MTIRSTLIMLALGALFSAAAGAQSPAPVTQPSGAKRPCSKPEWPRESLRRGESGIVTLKFLVDEEGKVVDSYVRKSSGFVDLDEAARRGIARCDFTPSMRNGQPIRAWVAMQYVWTIQEKSSDSAVEEAKALGAAGAKGDLDALYKLSTILTDGGGVRPNPAGAAKLLHTAAENGHAQAALTLAQHYESGRLGLPRDAGQARSWYMKAAELGSDQAQYKIGTTMLGAGEPVATAATWLRKAADQGHGMAAYELARLLEKGKGIEPNSTEALRLLRTAAGKDIANAQHALAVALLRGPGTQAEAAEAVRWLTAATEDRHGDAELLLAELKLEGKTVPRDQAGGLQLLRRAADGGNVPAMAILGEMLARGLLVPANAAEGAQWTARAARHGAVERSYGSGYFSQLLARK